MIDGENLVALITITLLIVGLIIDIGVRIIAYTRNRQRDFYQLSNRMGNVELELKEIKYSNEEIIKQLNDVQGILKKEGFYNRRRDN